jgi:hypothetical protein
VAQEASRNGPAGETPAANGPPHSNAEARRAHLTQAQSILIGMGLITILLEAIILIWGGRVQRAARLPAAEWTIAAGVSIVLMGIFVPRFPIPMTAASLVLFLGVWLGLDVWARGSAGPAPLMKVLVAVCLVKALQAARSGTASRSGRG